MGPTPSSLTTFPAISTECGCGWNLTDALMPGMPLHCLGVLNTGTLMDLGRQFSRRTMDSLDTKRQLGRQADLCF